MADTVVNSGPLIGPETETPQASAMLAGQSPQPLPSSAMSMPTAPAAPQPSTVVEGKPNMFGGILAGALAGMAASQAGKNNFFGGMFAAQQAQQQEEAQQAQEERQNALVQASVQKSQADVQHQQSESSLAQANAAKAMVDMLHTEAMMKQMPEEMQLKVADSFAKINDAFIHAGYSGTEIDDTPEARTAYLQQMQQAGITPGDVIFSADPKAGKILAYKPDPSKMIKADDVENIGKQLGLNLPKRDMDPQVFSALTAGAVRLNAEALSNEAALQRTQIQAGATLGAANIHANATLGAANIRANATEQAANKLTSSTRTMIEAAPKVIDFVDRIQNIMKNADLGPVSGRFQEFMAGKIGAPNPTFTQLRTDVGLLQTLLMRMHVGARGGEYIMKHFQDLIDSGKQSPENLQAALGEIKWYANQITQEGQDIPYMKTPTAGAIQPDNGNPWRGAGTKK